MQALALDFQSVLTALKELPMRFYSANSPKIVFYTTL